MTAVALKVMITGASSGIGKALAMEYARRGATLGLIARRHDLLRELEESLPVRPYIYAADVTNASAIANAAEHFTDRAGIPDIVIGNAGIGAGTLTSRSEDNTVFEEIMKVNLIGLMLTFQPFVEAMRNRGTGILVGIASVAGFRGLPGAAAYSASKAAAISYLESLRVELHGSGISVVTICPGYIATPLTSGNPYRMPFLMNATEAAKKITSAIDARKRFYVFPWQMALVGWFLRRLPAPLYELLFAQAPRKPRRSPD